MRLHYARGALAGFDKDLSAQLDDRPFLRAVLEAPADRFPVVGLGEELRIETGEIGGGAIQLKGALVHLFAFRRSNPDGTIRRTLTPIGRRPSNCPPAARGPNCPGHRYLSPKAKERHSFHSALISPEQEKICDPLPLPLRKMTAPS